MGKLTRRLDDFEIEQELAGLHREEIAYNMLILEQAMAQIKFCLSAKYYEGFCEDLAGAEELLNSTIEKLDRLRADDRGIDPTIKR